MSGIEDKKNNLICGEKGGIIQRKVDILKGKINENFSDRWRICWYKSC